MLMRCMAIDVHAGLVILALIVKVRSCCHIYYISNTLNDVSNQVYAERNADLYGRVGLAV